MTTGRERVLKALTFSNPDRTPRDVWALPYISLYRKDELETLLTHFPMDIGASQLSPGWSDAAAQTAAKAGPYTDDWAVCG